MSNQTKKANIKNGKKSREEIISILLHEDYLTLLTVISYNEKDNIIVSFDDIYTNFVELRKNLKGEDRDYRISKSRLSQILSYLVKFGLVKKMRSSENRRKSYYHVVYPVLAGIIMSDIEGSCQSKESEQTIEKIRKLVETNRSAEFLLYKLMEMLFKRFSASFIESIIHGNKSKMSKTIIQKVVLETHNLHDFVINILLSIKYSKKDIEKIIKTGSDQKNVFSEMLKHFSKLSEDLLHVKYYSEEILKPTLNILRKSIPKRNT